MNLYRAAIRLRHRLAAPEELTWLDAQAPSDQVLVFARPISGPRVGLGKPVGPGDPAGSGEPVAGPGATAGVGDQGGIWVCAANFGPDPVPMPTGELLLASGPPTPDGRLPGETTVWLRR